MEHCTLFSHLCCICAHSLTSSDRCSIGHCCNCSGVIKWHNDCISNPIVSLHGDIACIICKNTRNHFQACDDINSPLSSIDPDINSVQSFQATNCKYYDYNFFQDITNDLWDQKLTLYHVNARSLNSNFNNLLLSLRSVRHNFSVIGITETWLGNPNTLHTLYNIPGYNMEHASRQGRGGGVALYINSSLKYKSRSDLSIFVEGVFESTFIELQASHSPIIIGVIYCPSGVSETVLDMFSTLFISLNREDRSCFLMGDFNCNLLITSENIGNQFINLVHSHSFRPLHNLPSRITSHSATLLDVIFTNSPSLSSTSGIICDDISDHFPVFTIVDIDNVKTSIPSITLRRHVNPATIRLFRSAIENETWQDVFYGNDVNVAFDQFNKIFSKHLNNCLPYVPSTKKGISDKNDWMTPAILNSCRTKNRLYKKYLRSRTANNLNDYKRFRNRLTSVIRLAKKSYYTNMFNNNNQDAKSMWRSINTLLHGRQANRTPEQINYQGVSFSNPMDIGNIFNDYFTTIGPATQHKIPNVNSHYKMYLQAPVIDSLFIIPATRDEVLKVLLSLKPSAAGFDGVSAIIVKHVAHSLCIPLTYLCNLSFELGVVPTSLKIARVVPVFKAGEKESVNNYRPISVLPCFSKVIEKIMFSRLYNFIAKHNLLYNYQFGFLPGRSTTHAILHFTCKVMEAFENNQYASGIFLDLSKAFDTLDHNILLDKLNHYGIRGTVLQWFKSYLADRHQFVVINNINSVSKPIKCGVPQGSILGPLLFIIYVNDLYRASNKFHIISYADDTNLFFSSNDINFLLDTIQNEFTYIHDWFCANKLSLNVKKTTSIVFSTPSKHLNPNINSIRLCGVDVMLSKTTKFLGVYIDNHLSWNNHIQNICMKVSKGAGVLNRLRQILPRSTLVTLYNTLILPYLTYCNVIWGSTHASRIQPLYLLQKRAIRYICNADYLQHTAPLFTTLNALSIYDINRYYVGIFIFNWLHDNAPSTFRNYFQLRNDPYPNRAPNQLTVPYFRLRSAQLGIRYVGVKLWNSLPTTITGCKTLNTFKKRLKEYLISNYH